MSMMDKSDEPISAVSITRELEYLCEKVLEKVDSRAVPVTDEMLVSVATISANNDAELGKVISDAYIEVGRNGVVTVEKSDTPETTTEVIKGIRVDRGYASPLFVNDQRRDQCIMDDVRVLISDAEISNVLSIEKILKPIIQQQQKLLIIAPCSANVINTLAANVMKNGLKLCTIEPPSFGYRSHELMSDIAMTVGGTFFSQKTGDDLSIIEESDLGIAKRIVASKDNTIIMRPDDVDVSAIDGRIAELWAQRDTLTNTHERDFVVERIASLSGGIGVISVGGHTDLEQKEKFDRVDDAVCAVRAAISEGIVAGGGVTLNGLSSEIDPEGSVADEIAAEAMMVALGNPMRQILVNSGMTVDEADGLSSGFSVTEGIDVKTGEYGDMVQMGVIDPAKVTKTALRSAVSVANTILSTNAIVTMARSYETSK
jgi:chaperonin GroEL